MSRDLVETLIAALGPGTVGLSIAMVGLGIRVPRWRHRRIWCASLTLILLQAAIIALVIATFGDGEIRPNLFTICGGIGLLCSIGGLVAYGFKAFKAEGP